MDPSLFHGLPDTPFHILADGLAFSLSEGSHDGCHHLAVFVDGINVLFFEHNCDPKSFEEPYVVQAVNRVSSEAGDGLYQNEVYLLLFAFANHLEELRPLGGLGSGDTFIGIDPSHRPFRIRHDFIGIVCLLCFVAGELLLIICGDTAVGRNTKLPFDHPLFEQFWPCRYYYDVWCDSSHCHSKSPFPMVCPFFSSSSISPLTGIRIAEVI